MTPDEMPMLACGCRANALGVSAKMRAAGQTEPVPSCVIHECFEVNTALEDALKGRMARCFYYGSPWGRMNECNYDCKDRKDGCRCERPSDGPALPFFSHHSEQPYDEFYCGCHSWN